MTNIVALRDIIPIDPGVAGCSPSRKYIIVAAYPRSWPSSPEQASISLLPPSSVLEAPATDTSVEKAAGHGHTAVSVSSRPEKQRSQSLSPPSRKSGRFLQQHSPTSSPRSRLNRWVRKLEQECDRCPVIGSKNRESRPKDEDGLLGEPEDPRETNEPEASPSEDQPISPEVLEIPMITPDSDSTISPDSDFSGSPDSPISPSLRGRPDEWEGSFQRSRRPHRRSAVRKPDLPSIIEEAEDEQVGLGIQCD